MLKQIRGRGSVMIDYTKLGQKGPRAFPWQRPYCGFLHLPLLLSFSLIFFFPLLSRFLLLVLLYLFLPPLIIGEIFGADEGSLGGSCGSKNEDTDADPRGCQCIFSVGDLPQSDWLEKGRLEIVSPCVFRVRQDGELKEKWGRVLSQIFFSRFRCYVANFSAIVAMSIFYPYIQKASNQVPSCHFFWIFGQILG